MDSSGELMGRFTKASIFFRFVAAILGILVIFAIVPNSFAISIAGAVFSFLWFLTSTKEETFLEAVKTKKFLTAMGFWAVIVVIAACVQTYLRHVSPGYDLSWFVQAITNAAVGEGLRVTSEREISHLVQHWEPILYSAVPLTFLFNGSIAVVLWQGLAYIGGSIAAWKISAYLFDDSNLKSLKYLTTILFLVAWINVNPLMYDSHPPVFGTLLLIPWIFYFILTKKSSYIILFLSLILMQCGEIFFAVAPVFVIYCLLREKVTIMKLVLSAIIYCTGFFLIAAYQKYFGPFITGDSFPFTYRYAAIGGDGVGILKTFLNDPISILSYLLTIAKIKTILKIFLYCGPFALIAMFSKKFRLLAVCLSLGCLPYFIQAGLSPGMETNYHYVSSIGTIWWLLTVIGIYFLLYEVKSTSKFFQIKNFIFNKRKLVAFFCILFFLNTSEWRKSLLYPFRAIVDRDNVSAEVRNYLADLDREKGVVFAGSEWLCPLVADYRKWLLCDQNGRPNVVLPKMPLDVVVATKDGLIGLYNILDTPIKNSAIGFTIQALINEKPEQVGWKKIGDYSQNAEPISSKDKNFRHYTIWEKVGSL